MKNVLQRQESFGIRKVWLLYFTISDNNSNNDQNMHLQNVLIRSPILNSYHKTMRNHHLHLQLIYKFFITHPQAAAPRRPAPYRLPPSSQRTGTSLCLPCRRSRSPASRLALSLCSAAACHPCTTSPSAAHRTESTRHIWKDSVR